MCALELKHDYSSQHYLQFNPRQSSQLVSNSTTQVLFYEWSHRNGLNCYDPELSGDVRKTKGKLILLRKTQTKLVLLLFRHLIQLVRNLVT